MLVDVWKCVELWIRLLLQEIDSIASGIFGGRGPMDNSDNNIMDATTMMPDDNSSPDAPEFPEPPKFCYRI